jgi:hypothetical protein
MTAMADDAQTPAADAAPEPEDKKPEKKQTVKRPDALYFIGERLTNGDPVQHLAGYGIDARDFEPGDPFLARLTDEQITMALDSKLYRRTKPDSSKE